MPRGGKRPGAGRKKGSPNKITASVKEAILEAFNEVGGSAYLVGVAQDNPAVFCQLVGKVIPLQVAGDPDGAPIAVAVIERVIVDPKAAD